MHFIPYFAFHNTIVSMLIIFRNKLNGNRMREKGRDQKQSNGSSPYTNTTFDKSDFFSDVYTINATNNFDNTTFVNRHRKGTSIKSVWLNQCTGTQPHPTIHKIVHKKQSCYKIYALLTFGKWFYFVICIISFHWFQTILFPYIA